MASKALVQARPQAGSASALPMLGCVFGLLSRHLACGYNPKGPSLHSEEYLRGGVGAAGVASGGPTLCRNFVPSDGSRARGLGLLLRAGTAPLRAGYSPAEAGEWTAVARLVPPLG